MKLLNLSILIAISTTLVLVSNSKAKADIFSDLNNIKQTIDRTRSTVEGAGSAVNGSGTMRGAENNTNASTNSKYPCIEDVCIGDELKNLSRINWQPANLNIIFRGQTRAQKSLKAVGDPESIAAIKPYWYAYVMDNKAIKILSGIKGFCQVNQGMNGIYLDKSGRKVRVGFLPQLSNDGQSQTYVVTSILQHLAFLKDVSKPQIEDLQSQIKQKYPPYGGNNPFDASSVRMTLVADPIAVYSLSIHAPTQGPKSFRIMRENDFFNFPGCPRDPKIKL